MMTMMSRLAPLSEEPTVNDQDHHHSSSSSSSSLSRKSQTWRHWFRTHFPLLLSHKKSDLKLLLSVLACPLFPVSPSSPFPSPSHVSSSAQYIIGHFTAATGCRKMEGKVRSMYAAGKVTMAVVDELASAASAPQKGCFVMWQMAPDKWLIELVVGGQKVLAGSDGALAWRHTPWLGSHAAKGRVRPLRRALQGLDPLAIASVFSQAQYVGEKMTGGTDCFVLKVSADHSDLADRSDTTAEMIKHVTYGHFSQRSGLLVFLEDSYLTRIQSPGTRPIYWETTISTRIDDYRPLDFSLVAHSGRSDVTITRFGDDLRSGPVVTRLEESWTIDDVAVNVEGLSVDCFIPPTDVGALKDLTPPPLNLDYACRSPLHR